MVRTKARPTRKRSYPRTKVTRKRKAASASTAAKKRKTAARKAPRARMSRVTAEARRQLALYHNPFSRSTGQPKIPDGKAGYSLGLKSQQIKELNNATTFTTLHCLLYPGAGGGLAVYGVNEGGPSAVTNQWLMGYNDHGNININDLTGKVSGDSASFTTGDNYPKWRVVSQGVTARLVNPGEEDDGWWEAVRLTEENDPGNFSLLVKENGTDNATASIGPNPLFMATLAITNLVDQKSYTTGRLKDIHKTQFDLHALGEEHDFVDRYQRTTVTVGSDCSTIVNNRTNLTAGSGVARDIFRSEYDNSMDCVYLRIHCRTNTGSGTQLGSRVVFHVVGNQEVVYGLNQKESKYHTETHEIGQEMDMHTQAMRADNAAARMKTD